MKKTKDNPYGLTTKQMLTVREMVRQVEKGKGISPTDAHEKFYEVASRKSASAIAASNMRKPNFRKALTYGLEKKNIIGADSQVEKRLTQGLNAEKSTPNGTELDFPTILNYIKEINKIAGVYAPQKTQKMNLNVDVTGSALDKRIEDLQKELGGEDK